MLYHVELGTLLYLTFQKHIFFFLILIAFHHPSSDQERPLLKFEERSVCAYIGLSSLPIHNPVQNKLKFSFSIPLCSLLP